MLDKSDGYCYYIKTERTLFFKYNEREVQSCREFFHY